MKSGLLLIALLTSFSAFGQTNNFGNELDDYVIISNHKNAKGLDFKFKSPSGYNEMSPSSSNTVKLYSSGNSEFGDREILIQVFDYKTYFPEGELINKSNINEIIGDLNKNNPSVEYCSMEGYPGWIFQENEDIYTSLQINLFLEKHFLVVSFTSIYVIGPSDIDFIKKLTNSIRFI